MKEHEIRPDLIPRKLRGRTTLAAMQRASYGPNMSKHSEDPSTWLLPYQKSGDSWSRDLSALA